VIIIRYVFLLGILAILVGMILVIASAINSKTKGGFIVWIGPFPIIGATDKKMFYTVITLSIIFLILILFWKKTFI